MTALSNETVNAEREDASAMINKALGAVETANDDITKANNALDRARQALSKAMKAANEDHRALMKASIDNSDKAYREQAAYNRGRDDERAKLVETIPAYATDGAKIEGVRLDGKIYRLERLKLCLALCNGMSDHDLVELLDTAKTKEVDEPLVAFIMQCAKDEEELEIKNKVLSTVARAVVHLR